MHILLKLDYAKFGFSNLFFLKLSKKLWGSALPPPPLVKQEGLRPPQHRLVFIKKSATIVRIEISFRIVFIAISAIYTKAIKLFKTVTTTWNLLFLKNWWFLLPFPQKFAFSVKTIRLHDNDIVITISFSNLFFLETVFKSNHFQWKE